MSSTFLKIESLLTMDDQSSLGRLDFFSCELDGDTLLLGADLL